MATETEIRGLAFETDTALSELYNERAGKQERLASRLKELAQTAGARFYYRGRQRVTDMTEAEAREIVVGSLVEAGAWRATHDSWIGYEGAIEPYNLKRARQCLDMLDELREEIREINGRMDELEKVYAAHQWSRFFLVTSSAGHIHCSMYCSTCRITTTYGWLPELSGASEAEAVEKFGGALCSVCFASAPVEWQGGRITKSAAAKAAA